MADPFRTPLRIASAALVALGLANLLPGVGRFSGDAMIHLSIAERAARGGWFEFNPGEVSAATTSVAWTAFEAALLRVGGFPFALAVVASVSVAALVLAASLVRRFALRLGASPAAATVGALLFASLPGVASNAPLGMENTAFAAASMAFLLRVTAPAAWERVTSVAAHGLLLGACGLLRPEGVVLVLPALVACGSSRGRASRGFIALLSSAVMIAPVVYVHWRVTGRWVPASGISRMMAARRDPLSLHLAGPLWLYLGALARFATLLPLVLLAFVAARADNVPPTPRRVLITAIVAGLLLYSLVTGAAHVARLSQWLWAPLAALAAAGVSRLLARAEARSLRVLAPIHGGLEGLEKAARAQGAQGAQGSEDGDEAKFSRSNSSSLATPAPLRPLFPLQVPRATALVLLGVAHISVACVETVARWRQGTTHGAGLDRSTILRAIDRRASGTDRLLRALCEGGCCRDGVTPAVALIEVQRRLSLDARVAVTSLDGVTSSVRGAVPTPAFDAATGCPSLDPVLRRPAVLGLFENPRNQLPRCPLGPLATALSLRWGDAAHAPAGWRWNTRLHGWVKQCAPAQSSSAAPSIASASRTVASRTAARPTSP